MDTRIMIWLCAIVGAVSITLLLIGLATSAVIIVNVAMGGVSITLLLIGLIAWMS